MAASRVARFSLIALAVVLLIALVTGVFWLRWLGQYLVQADQAQRSDVILVLAGDWTGERVLTAAKLAREGFAPQVWVSGPMELYGVNEATLAINYAVAHGYPREMFSPKLLPATSTAEEARQFKGEIARNNVHSILLVTNNFHTRRAGTTFRQVLGPQVRVRVFATPYMHYHPDDWWKSREDQKTWFFEWSKTLAHALGI